MQDSISPSVDKTIVERRDRRADDKSRRAVREVRAGLGSSNTTATHKPDQFAIDMLLSFAATLRKSALVSILLTLFATYLVAFTLPKAIFLGFMAANFAIIAVSTFLAVKFRRLKNEKRNGSLWERIFWGAQAVLGTSWAVLFALHPFFGEYGVFSVLNFAGALVLIGFFLITAAKLRYGVLLSTLPVVAVVVSRFLMIGNFTTLALAVVLSCAFYFAHRLGDIMRNSQIGYLKSKAERDQLIMQLEDSRSISEEARRRAEDANLAKSRFLATMSHELRTPLNAILGFSEVMSNEVMGPLNNEYYKEYAGDIHTSGTHLLKLINEILDLSRVEAGRYKLNEEATNLAHAAEESQQMVKLKASEKNVTLAMQIQPDLPQIWADARAVRQVILNLLSNAIKFTPSGGMISLKVGWTAGGGQYVSIKDTGPGIPEEEIPIVLSSFGQGSIAIKSAEQGTGLGLPIVQALVHMHDGSFELKSKLREGTEVIATFPRGRVLEVMPAIPVDGQTVAQGTQFNRPRKQVDAPPMAAS